MFLMIVVVGTW